MNDTHMKTRILVVDDLPDFTRVMRMCLEMEGEFEVQEENDAMHAVEAVRQFHPDVVLLDVMMPNLSGLEVAQYLQNDAQLKRIPVVFLSCLIGTKEEGSPSTFPMSSPHAFLSKSVSAAELLAQIKKVARGATNGYGGDGAGRNWVV
jgi:CheY-like chemotaxis protein